MDKKTAKAIRQLRSRIIIFGPLLREKGAVSLSGTSEPEAVFPLVEAMEDEKEKVRSAAQQALTTLQGPAVDKLCALWEENREGFLERIIRDCDYFAENPKRLRYITCLMRDFVDQVVDADNEGVDILISLMFDKDRRVAANSEKSLWELKNPDGIDRLCAVWENKRHESLKKIILECGYIARKPNVLLFKTMYLHGMFPQALPDDDTLTACLLDPEDPIMKNVIDHEMSMEGDTGFNRMWGIAMQHPDSKIAEALITSGRFPADASERVLFYFLAGALDQYHDIDFDQSVLSAWYESGGTALKESIARRIRQSGDARLLSVFRTPQGGPKKSLSSHEVEVQIGIMIKNMNFSGLFDLLAFATYDQATRIILALKQAGRHHPDPRFAEMQSRLETVLTQDKKIMGPSSYAGAMYRDFRPMFFGNEQPPSKEEDLLAWLTDDKNYRRRSAALILLAENGSSALPDAANSACNDAYWQVRMAAAAAELLRPGNLSPANRALLFDDHVFWVQALLKLPAGGRLSELGPAGLEMLRQDSEFSGPDKKPSEPDNFMTRIRGLISPPERDYFLILGEYLSTEGEFFEEGHVDAGMMDVEVIFEE